MITLNYFAIFASAVASMIIGSIWYGLLFGKKYIKEMGMDKLSAELQDEMKKSMMKLYALQFVASLLMFTILDWYIITTSYSGIVGGVMNALMLWIGFVVPLALGSAIWGGKMSLFWLSIGNMLLTLLAAGAIMGMWR